MSDRESRIYEFGTPAQSLWHWLETFARDNDNAARWALTPWTRARLRGRAAAFRDAQDLLAKAMSGHSAFPITLEPGESVHVEFPLYPEASA